MIRLSSRFLQKEPLLNGGLRRVSSYCLLFPGQGSQHVGMGKQLIAAASAGASPAVAELFQMAEEVLGYDLRPLLLQGPQERLDETVHCQPAIVVASLAALKAADPKVDEWVWLVNQFA